MNNPQAVRTTVAEEVRALMGRRKVNQTALAEVLGTTQPSVSKRLDGKIAFDVDELSRIAEFFDVPITDLFGRPRGIGGDVNSPRYQSPEDGMGVLVGATAAAA